MIRFLRRLFRVEPPPLPQVGDWWEVTGLEDLEGTMCKITAVSGQHVKMVCYTADGLTSYTYRTERAMLWKFYKRAKAAERVQGEQRHNRAPSGRMGVTVLNETLTTTERKGE